MVTILWTLFIAYSRSHSLALRSQKIWYSSLDAGMDKANAPQQTVVIYGIQIIHYEQTSLVFFTMEYIKMS